MTTGHSPHVLLIDDDELILNTFGMFFKSVGWTYGLESDSRQGLKEATDKEFDVVITDLMMPELDGLSLLRELRERKPSQAVMVLTGRGTLENVIQFLRQGAVDVILKPVDLESFKCSVERVVECLRTSQEEHEIFKYVAKEETRIECITSEIVSCSAPFPILDRLQSGRVIDMTTKLRLLLAFQEALTNSIDHGNLDLKSSWREEISADGIDRYMRVRQERLNDPKYATRKIILETKYSPGSITIEITDQGSGFDFSSIDQRNIDSSAGVKCYGRGVAIIKGTMDSVSYSNGGRTVKMMCNLDHK